MYVYIVYFDFVFCIYICYVFFVDILGVLIWNDQGICYYCIYLQVCVIYFDLVFFKIGMLLFKYKYNVFQLYLVYFFFIWL